VSRNGLAGVAHRAGGEAEVGPGGASDDPAEPGGPVDRQAREHRHGEEESRGFGETDGLPPRPAKALEPNPPQSPSGDRGSDAFLNGHGGDSASAVEADEQ